MVADLALTELFGKPLDGKRTLMIAEGGTNFSRPKPFLRPAACYGIIRNAKAAGADAIKFQLFMPKEPLFCPLPGDELRWKRWEKALMSRTQWAFVIDYAQKIGIPLFFSVFQHSGIAMLQDFGIKTWKVASRAAKTFPYEQAGGSFVVSTGLGWPEKRPENAVFLQCCVKYPAPLAESWWKVGQTDGLSDHSGKMWPAIDAIVKGAKLIELHFISGRGIQGRGRPDFTSSIRQHQFELIARCRDDIAAMRQDRL